MLGSPPLTAASLALLVSQFERGSMFEHLVTVVDALASPVVFVDPDATTLTLGSELVDDGWLPRRMSLLAYGVSGSKALARAVMARTGTLRVERGTGRDGISGEGLAGTFATLAVSGVATLADDLAVAIAIGFAPDSAAAIGGRLRDLGDDGGVRARDLRVTVYSGEDPEGVTLELGIEASADLRIAASPVGGRPRFVRIGTPPIATATVGYSDLAIEDAIRAVAAMATRPDHAARLRAIAATLGRDRVELELGAHVARIGFR